MCGVSPSFWLSALAFAILHLPADTSFVSAQEVHREVPSREALAAHRSTLAFGKALLKVDAKAAMVPWNYEQLPHDIKSRNAGDLQRILLDLACPISGARPLRLKADCDAQVAVHVAKDDTEADMVQYRWSSGGRQLVAIVGRNGVQVLFDLHSVSECAARRDQLCVAATRAWVERVMRLSGRDQLYQDYHIDLAWPDSLNDGVAFSSAPDLDITKTFRWHFRVDAEVQDGVLTIFTYKRVPNLMSFQDASKWFDNDFRALVQTKAAEQDH